jgi:hypothetical protein
MKEIKILILLLVSGYLQSQNVIPVYVTTDKMLADFNVVFTSSINADQCVEFVKFYNERNNTYKFRHNPCELWKIVKSPLRAEYIITISDRPSFIKPNLYIISNLNYGNRF